MTRRQFFRATAGVAATPLAAQVISQDKGKQLIREDRSAFDKIRTDNPPRFHDAPKSEQE